ncbi:MAG: FapA family protein [Fibromonadaceae bacterium]|jgi:uncharacterized protein (DUF342 family)|nr:FapA family protein [Fibromonadaceae bacterium]
MAEEEEIHEDEMGDNFNRFKISVTQDYMNVLLYPLINVVDGALTTYEEIIDACKREGIKAEIDEKLIEKQLVDANPVEVIIASGTKPTHGQDGLIKCIVDMSAKPQFIPDSKSGSLDYKNAMQVTLVNKGDILAEIIPPLEGEPGINVRGHAIPANIGAKARYFLGEGTEEKDGKVIATVSGTPSMQDDVITVRRNYVLQGDVDLSTGNIHFPGTVVIQGNVTDGFEVISGENVVINGLIAAAKIHAKGHVKCAGGIQGKGKADIVAGTFVAATFVNAAIITCDGDIVITKDILHSNVSCLGEIRLGGSFIGGVASAFKGIECGNIGSESGVKTVVNIRTHYRQEKAKEMANTVLIDANAIYERYKVWQKRGNLSDEEVKALMQDIITLQGLISKRQMFDSRAAKFDKAVLENKNSKAKVLGTLEADVVVASPYTRYNCMAPMKGPLIVTENNSAGKMAIVKGG